MGIFGKKKQSEPPPLTAEEQQQIAGFVAVLMEDVDYGLGVLGPAAPASSADLAAALTRLTEFSFRAQDERMVALLRRITIGYTLGKDPDNDLTDAQWGEMLLDNTSVIFEYRNAFTAAGMPGLERDLSLVATTENAVMEANPRHRAIMEAVMQAARDHVEGQQQS